MININPCKTKSFRTYSGPTEDGRSTCVFLLYGQLSQGRMADFSAFIASKSFHHIPYVPLILRQTKSVLGNLDLYLGTRTHTWEPGPKSILSMGPVPGNLDPYSGTWTRTREPILVYVCWLNIDGTNGTSNEMT